MTTSDPSANSPPPPPRRPRRWLRRTVGFLILLAALFLTRGWYLPHLGRFLDVSEPPRKADCVFVLGGGKETRPFVAAALVRAGFAERVLVATIMPQDEVRDGITPPEDELYRRVFLKRGVPAEKILQLPDVCNATRDEARALKRFLENEPATTVLVVTHDYHTRRTRMLFRREIGEKANHFIYVAAPTDGFDASDWWQSETGMLTYTDEFGKLLLVSLGIQ